MVQKHGTGILLAAILLPLNASALLCERTGSCADSRLNVAYQIKTGLQYQGNETRRAIREYRRTEVYRESERQLQREHRARRDLLTSPHNLNVAPVH